MSLGSSSFGTLPDGRPVERHVLQAGDLVRAGAQHVPLHLPSVGQRAEGLSAHPFSPERDTPSMMNRCAPR